MKNFSFKNITTINSKLYYVLILYVIIYLFSDIAYRFIVNSGIALTFRPSSIVNLIFEIILGIYIILNFKRCKPYLIYILLLFFCFLIGNHFSDTFISLSKNIALLSYHNDLIIFNSFVYIILFVAVFRLLDNKDEYVKKALLFLKYFLIINSIIIIVASIFKITYFGSYEGPERFGYSGLSPSRINISYLYMFAIIIEYKKYIKFNKIGILLLFIVSSLLIGKKANLLFVFLLLLIHVYSYINSRTIKIAFSLLLGTGIFMSKQIFYFLINQSSFWKSIYKDSDLVSVIFSYRNQLLNNLVEYIASEWSLINYFFGTIKFIKYRSEFGFIDLFAFLGTIGFIIYTCFIYFEFYRKQNIIDKLIFISILLTTSVSSMVFINVYSAIILYILSYFLKKELVINSENSLQTQPK